MQNQFKPNSKLTVSQVDALVIQIRRDGFSATVEYIGPNQDIRIFTSATNGQIMFSALECLPAHARHMPIVEKVFPNLVAKGVMEMSDGNFRCNI